MTSSGWTVNLIGQAKKAFKDLPEKVGESLVSLVMELEILGPIRYNWSNFSKLKDDLYHCHLQKGRPTYVACWRINKKEKKN